MRREWIWHEIVFFYNGSRKKSFFFIGPATKSFLKLEEKIPKKNVAWEQTKKKSKNKQYFFSFLVARLLTTPLSGRDSKKKFCAAFLRRIQHEMFFLISTCSIRKKIWIYLGTPQKNLFFLDARPISPNVPPPKLSGHILFWIFLKSNASKRSNHLLQVARVPLLIKKINLKKIYLMFGYPDIP